MTENLKKFLETVSANNELAQKIGSMTKENLIALAKELGLELTEADFQQPYGELSDDELDVVAGGYKFCHCDMGGGGKKDSQGKACACVIYGQGDARDGRPRCLCPFLGNGDSPECMADGW